MAYGIKFKDGAVATPAIRFANDTDSGLYRIGADNLGLSVGATKILDVASTGLGITGTLSASGVSTLPTVVTSTIRSSTSDASDNSSVALTGGGGADVTRGALITLRGNEHATPGALSLAAGNVANGRIDFATGGSERGRIIGGVLAWGTTYVGTVTDGNMTFANEKGLWASNAGGTATFQMISLTSNALTKIGPASGNPWNGGISAISTCTSAELVAGSATLSGVLVINTTDNRLVYYSNGNRYYLSGTSF